MEFNEGTRQLYVYGLATPDCVVEVYADNTLLLPPTEESKLYPYDSALGKIIFSFQTATSVLGSVQIKIKVLQGKVKLTRTRVQYPARFYNHGQQVCKGYYFMYQPIADPKYLVKINSQLVSKTNNIDQGEWHYLLESQDVMEYYHLMLDGPACWYIGCDVNNIDNDSLLYFNATDKTFFCNNELLNTTYYKDIGAHERLEFYKNSLLKS